MRTTKFAVFTFCLLFGSLLATHKANAQNVYWDISHGVRDNYQPSGRYDVLDSTDLSGFDIMVVATGSYADITPTSAEIATIESFVQSGGGLLILSEIAGAAGTPNVNLVANIFGAQVGLQSFPASDVFSTTVGTHPSVDGVNQIYLRFSSTFSPGSLTTYADINGLPMLAAGEFGAGRVVLIADGDLFTDPPGFTAPYIDNADNRQLAISTFDYLTPTAIPAPAALPAGIALLGMFGLKRKQRHA